MNALEIVLLIIGGVIFAAGFLIPVKKEELSQETKALAQKEIEDMVAKQMDNVQNRVDEVLEDSVRDFTDRAERSMEKLSNEKIMAVSEYSDTVLQEIHKNHEEVMFLYDMLNDKHTNLKKTMTEVNRTVKAVAEAQKEVDALSDSSQNPSQENAVKQENIGEMRSDVPDASETDKVMRVESEEGSHFTTVSDSDIHNSNDKILELYSQGKSKVAIAQELGLGVGEVKLVIDLYRNM